VELPDIQNSFGRPWICIESPFVCTVRVREWNLKFFPRGSIDSHRKLGRDNARIAPSTGSDHPQRL
jgi:hypothetical protein